jgi:CrcB protein
VRIPNLAATLAILRPRSDEARSITAAAAADGFYVTVTRPFVRALVEREPDVEPAELGPGALAAPRVDGRELAAIFAGGMLGAIGRGALEQALAIAPGSWPWATFAVNMLAAGLLGYWVTRLGVRDSHRVHARAFLATGVCGSLSTFSTMIAELIAMAERSRWGLACGYGAASIAGGLAVVSLGIALAHRRGR